MFVVQVYDSTANKVYLSKAKLRLYSLEPYILPTSSYRREIDRQDPNELKALIPFWNFQSQYLGHVSVINVRFKYGIPIRT